MTTWNKTTDTAVIYTTDFGTDDFTGSIYQWNDHLVWRLVDHRSKPSNAYGDTIWAKGDEGLEIAKQAIEQRFIDVAMNEYAYD